VVERVYMVDQLCLWWGKETILSAKYEQRKRKRTESQAMKPTGNSIVLERDIVSSRGGKNIGVEIAFPELTYSIELRTMDSFLLRTMDSFLLVLAVSFY
jgi:hypothetical protein